MSNSQQSLVNGGLNFQAYDQAGNPLVQDPNRYWVPAPLTQPPVTHQLMHDGPASQANFTNQQLDPALIPLPEPGNADADLIDGPTIAAAQGYTTGVKVAGSRHKGDGRKRKSNDTQAPSSSAKRSKTTTSENTPAPSKRGRPQGAGNFKAVDVDLLLTSTSKFLPLGQQGWNRVMSRYNRKAKKCGRPERTAKSLENKFKTLVKTKKPTGKAYCPPHITLAHEIDARINERAGTREVSDSEIIDGEAEDSGSEESGSEDDGVGNDAGGDDSDDSDDSESENDEDKDLSIPPKKSTSSAPKPTPYVARVARVEPSIARPCRNGGATAAVDLATKLAHHFDPAAQESRDNQRAASTFQNTQLLLFSQQLRDAQSQIETLRNQTLTLQTQAHKADRDRDQAEFKLKVLEMSMTMSQRTSLLRDVRNNPGWGIDPRDIDPRRTGISRGGLEKVRGKVRVEETFPGGGSQSYWVTDDSDGDVENRTPHPSPSFLDKGKGRALGSPFAIAMPQTTLGSPPLSPSTFHQS